MADVPPAIIEVITPELVEAVIFAESSGDPNATGSNDSRGLMQLKCGAWYDIQIHPYYGPLLGEFTFDEYAFDPGMNRRFGLAYLHITQERLPRRYQGSTRNLLAAYNLGITGFRNIGYDLRAIPAHTCTYIRNVMRHLYPKKPR